MDSPGVHYEGTQSRKHSERTANRGAVHNLVLGHSLALMVNVGAWNKRKDDEILQHNDVHDDVEKREAHDGQDPERYDSSVPEPVVSRLMMANSMYLILMRTSRK